LRDQRLRLADMLDAATAAQAYVATMTELKELQAERRSRDAVLHNLFVLGEAAKGVAPEVRDRYPGIPWRGLTGLRDVVGHEYFGVDDEVIWDVVKNQLPKLIEELRRALAAEGSG